MSFDPELKANLRMSILVQVVNLAKARKEDEKAKSDPARSVEAGKAAHQAELDFERVVRGLLDVLPDVLDEIVADETARPRALVAALANSGALK